MVEEFSTKVKLTASFAGGDISYTDTVVIRWGALFDIRNDGIDDISVRIPDQEIRLIMERYDEEEYVKEIAIGNDNVEIEFIRRDASYPGLMLFPIELEIYEDDRGRVRAILYFLI